MAGQVIAAVAVSVDGFIAGPGDGPGQALGLGGDGLFTWFEDGDVPGQFYPWHKMSAASAAAFDGFIARIGAVVTGRRTYDIVQGWDGQGEVPGAPLFVVTHRAPDQAPVTIVPYTFVTDGIASAVRQALVAAEGKDVRLMGASIIQQCLRAGLLDELTIELVPVILGGGVRLLDNLEPGTVSLDLVRVIDAPGVTHLTYQVTRQRITPDPAIAHGGRASLGTGCLGVDELLDQRGDFLDRVDDARDLAFRAMHRNVYRAPVPLSELARMIDALGIVSLQRHRVWLAGGNGSPQGLAQIARA